MTLIALAVMASAQPQANTPIAPPVSLAETYQDGIDVSEYWYSEKLDGIRAYWTGQHLVTRNGNQFMRPSGSLSHFRTIHWMVSFRPDAEIFTLFSKPFLIKHQLIARGAKSILWCLTCRIPQEITENVITTFRI